QSVFHPKGPNRNLSYGVLGNKFLVILDVETGAGSSTRWVSLINFDTMTEVPVLTVGASSTSIALPVVNQSAGSGTVFLAYGQNGTEHTSVAIYRSDNAAVLCSLGAPIVPTGQTVGEATATELKIHFSTGGVSKTQVCPRPLGKCTITPSSQTFADVFVGGCPFTAPTKQFTIKNTGTDCLTVNPISGIGPFTIQSTSKALPVSLSPNEQVDVTVAFNPATTGNWNPQNIPVSTSPANGDNQLVCKGQALAAAFKISFSATTINFGKKPVGQPQNVTLTITNTGSKAMTVSSAGVTADGFSVPPFSASLNCGQSLPVSVQFIPPSEGPHSALLSVSHSALGSPTSINLLGEGCIANAEILVPPTTPINFGQIQQAFRTVRFFKVSNPGDGPLNFQGAISGPDAALFGLPDPGGSVIDPPSTRNYSVDPVSPCGNLAVGSGETIVAIAFFAGDSPKIANATLTLSGHNASNFPAAKTWVFPLSAEITPPIAVDVSLVVDRSDSMNQSLGSRVKMDAAIAASQLFVELLRPNLDDRVAVARFNNQRNVLVPMTRVSTTSSPTQDQIRQQISTDIPPATGLTAIAGGTMLGIHEVQKPHPGNPSPLNRAVVVLTDGIENTAFEEPPGTWLSIKGGTMYTPTATVVTDTVNTSAVTWPGDIDRYAIGVGKPGEVDPSQLDALTGDPQRVMYVDQDLNGTLYFQLEKYYTQIFMNIVGTQPVLDPMNWIAPGDTHEIEFEVLRGDVDAIVVIYDFQGNRLPFFCVSPKGEIIDPVVIAPGFQLRSGFTSQARLVEFKMPLKEPDRYAGTWKVVILHKGTVCRGNPVRQSREPGFLPRDCNHDVKDPLLYGIAIGVGSDFRMFPFVTPAPVYVGEPILLTALVSEAGLPIKGCTVTVEATVPAGTTYNLTLADDGAHTDGDKDDGEYARQFTQTFAPGIYHFKFRTVGLSRDGNQVVREAVRDKPVLQRHVPDPPGTGQPGDGRPADGERPPREDCCEELLRQLKEQTVLLRNLAKQRKDVPYKGAADSE
ncbi:MAG: choice-of-anchor D domain-containing protein, partial [Acidobacteriota bacterium]|nr:choice-of-anchor D domain-containing protein [Acidobacteriota bacterium]